MNDTLLEVIVAIVAVALVIMFFVGRLATIFAVIVAIPISIAGAFILFAIMGFTLNLITLLAITVAVGLVVDDAIVVAENIDRFQSMGYDRKEAVIQGASEVAAAVLAATLSLLGGVFTHLVFARYHRGLFRRVRLGDGGDGLFQLPRLDVFLDDDFGLPAQPAAAGVARVSKALGKFRGDLGWTLKLYRKIWFYVLARRSGGGAVLRRAPAGCSSWPTVARCPVRLALRRQAHPVLPGRNLPDDFQDGRPHYQRRARRLRQLPEPLC